MIVQKIILYAGKRTTELKLSAFSIREKIVPHESSFKVKKSVIELVLVKVVPSRWASLEKMKLSLTGNMM